MLKIIFGYGLDDETAIGAALDEYNSVAGRKTYHESKVRQIVAGNGVQQFRCEIWYTLNVTVEEQKEEEEKYYYIGSTDVDPNDPNWRKKLYGDMNEPATDDPNLTTVAAIPTVDFEVHHVGEVES